MATMAAWPLRIVNRWLASASTMTQVDAPTTAMQPSFRAMSPAWMALAMTHRHVGGSSVQWGLWLAAEFTVGYGSFMYGYVYGQAIVENPAVHPIGEVTGGGTKG